MKREKRTIFAQTCKGRRLASHLLLLSLLCIPLYNDPASGQDSQNPSQETALSLARSNPIIKRRLEADHNLFVTATPEGFEVILPARSNIGSENKSQALWYFLSMGRFHAGNTDAVKPQSKPREPRTAGEKQIAATRELANNLLSGRSQAQSVLNELGTPPNVEGDYQGLKANEQAVCAAQCFDLFEAGYAQEALAKLPKLAGSKALAVENNRLVLLGHKEPLKALNAFSPLCRNWQDSVLLGANQAYLLAQNGRYEDARENFASLLERASGRFKLYILLNLAKIAQQTNDSKAARTYLERAVSAFPSNQEGLLLLADAYIQEKEYKKAITALSPLAAADKKDPTAALKIATCYKASGDLDSAIKRAIDATTIAPEDPLTHIALGNYYLDNKDFLGARLQFERVNELDCNFSAKSKSFKPFLKVLDIMNDEKRLGDWTEKWLKEYPNEAICHYNRAWFLSRGKKLDQAIDEYERTLSLAPTMQSARFNLIYLLCKLKRGQKAKEQAKLFLEGSNSAQDRAQVEQMLQSLGTDAK